MEQHDFENTKLTRRFALSFSLGNLIMAGMAAGVETGLIERQPLWGFVLAPTLLVSAAGFSAMGVTAWQEAWKVPPQTERVTE